MIKNYKKVNAQQQKLLPERSTVNFILNYSKSTRNVKNDTFHFMTFQN